MNIVRVYINGIEYSLKGEEREEYLHIVASYVNKKILEIKGNNNKLSTSSAAVLTAVNIGDELFKVQKECSEAVDEIEKLEKQTKSAKDESIFLKKQLSYMENYNTELLEKIKKSENADFISTLENKIKKLNEQINILNEDTKKYLNETKKLNQENRALKFKNQSYNTDIINLKKEVVSKEIDLAKEKKMRNPLIKVEDIS